MNPKKIALLDLGGVVFQSTGISNEKIHWDIISQLNHKYGQDLNIGKDLFPTFIMEYNELSKQTLSGSDFLESVFDTLSINQKLIDLVSKNHEIIIVSDNYRENIEYISRRYQFDQWSIKQIYSFDYQMEKANPAFFKRLLDEVDHDKKDLIFIDDSPHKLESARTNGISGILFQNNSQVEKDLEQFYKNL